MKEWMSVQLICYPTLLYAVHAESKEGLSWGCFPTTGHKMSFESLSALGASNGSATAIDQPDISWWHYNHFLQRGNKKSAHISFKNPFHSQCFAWGPQLRKCLCCKSDQWCAAEGNARLVLYNYWSWIIDTSNISAQIINCWCVCYVFSSHLLRPVCLVSSEAEKTSAAQLGVPSASLRLNASKSRWGVKKNRNDKWFSSSASKHW